MSIFISSENIKISEILRFSDVFSRYRNSSVAWNILNNFPWTQSSLYLELKEQLNFNNFLRLATNVNKLCKIRANIPGHFLIWNICEQLIFICPLNHQQTITLREKYPNTDLFLVRISRIWTECDSACGEGRAAFIFICSSLKHSGTNLSNTQSQQETL